MMRGASQSAVDLEERGGLRNNMMNWANNSPSVFWLHSTLALITWILFIAVLAALLRLLWKKGNK